MYKIIVLVSGGGSNLQAIINAIKEKKLKAKIVAVISNNNKAYALTRASENNITSYCLTKNKDHKLLEILNKYQPNLIVLAGYLAILKPEVIKKFPKKIINIHPSLIPKYSGKNFYGLKIHQEVIKNNEYETGVSVHYVDEGIDTGTIIKQEKINITPNISPEELQKLVLKIEHKVLVQTIEKIIFNNNTF